MKKVTIMAFLLAALAPLTQMWAGTATYYAKLTTGLTSLSPTGSGTVYIGKAEAGNTSTYSSETRSLTNNASESYTSSKPSSLDVTFYLSAKANYGYKFVGWYDNAAGTGTVRSKNADYSFSVSSSASSESSPKDAGGCYAKFEENTSCSVTLIKPEVGVTSYTVTGPTGFSGSGLSNGGEMTVYSGESYRFVCTVAEGYEFVKWLVDGTDAGTSSTLDKTFSSAATVQAVVNKLETYDATCLAVPAGCSYKAGNEVVSSSEYKVSGYGTVSVSLSAPTAANGYMFAGWYTVENDVKTYISTESSATVSRKSDVTIGAEFVEITAPIMLVTSEGTVDYDDFDSAFADAKSGDRLKIVGNGTLTSAAAVVAGVTLEVASSVTLTVADSATLYIDGSATVNGTISGAVSKCTKLIKQTGQSDGTPFNPYNGDEKYQVKYWKTAITTPSISVSGAATHVTIINGKDETIYRGASANAFVCTTDKSVAINHIKSVKASYSSGTDAYNAVSKNSHNVSSASCNLTSSAASELVLLTAAGTVSVGSSTALTSGFIADCAGYNISFTSKQFGNAANVVVINGATVTSSKLTNARLTAINCTTVKGAGTDGINSNQTSYYTSLHLYDCSSFSNFNFSKSNVIMTAGTPGVCFFSGGTYSPSFTGNYHVYGGVFSKDPSNYLATNDLEVSKEGNVWVVRTMAPTPNVAKVGSAEYDSLQNAVNAAASSSGAVELLPGIEEVELEAPVTVAHGATVTIDLAGFAITAPNGAIINNGTLHLQDTSTFDVPGSITTANGNLIVNNGVLDVTYGKYTGGILLNGGTFTTHFGTFDGAVTVADGFDKKEVANLRGGEFSQSMSAFLRDGYVQFYVNPIPADPKRYWVCEFPITRVSGTTYSSAEKAWKLDFLSSSDLALYKKTKSISDHSSLANWQRRAELYSAIQPYSGNVLDCGLSFDRPVASGSVTFYGKTQASVTESIGQDLAKNEDIAILAHRIYEMNYTPFSYGRSIDEVETVTAGVKNNSNANIGTVCTVNLRVCTQDKNTPGIYKKLQTLIDVRYMLGGKKAAIDRGESRVAYDSLADAASDVQEGETILVGADTSADIAVTKVCTIDSYGFNFSGKVMVDDDKFDVIAKGGGVYEIKLKDPVTKVDIEAVVSNEWMEANNIDVTASQEEVQVAVQEKLKENDDNELPKWENLVLGQDSATKPAIEATAGGTETTATIAVSFEVPKDEEGEVIDTGYTVKYAFDKVDISTGEVVEDGLGETQDTPSLGLEGVTEDVPAYFTMRAVLEASDNSGVTTNVPVEKTIGVMKVNSDAEYTILAVPWKSLGDGDVKASELVHAASLQDGDQLIVYGKNGTPNKWTVRDGEWVSEKRYDMDEDEPEASAPIDPSTVGLERGQGVWLKRTNPENSPIYLIGQPSDEDDVETALAEATVEGVDGEQSWNLVASPSVEPIDVTDVLETSGAKADRVIIPMGSNAVPKNFHYNARKGKWGYDSTEIVYADDGVTPVGVRAVFKTDDAKLPAGTGFWYLNSSKDSSKTIKW